MKPDNIEPLKEYLATAIAYIIDTREKMKRPPYMALTSNIRNVVSKDIDRALGCLVESGLLTEHVMLNEKAYEFTPPKRTVKTT